jgi:lipopolysaccharide biosynthesis regulator YciM
MFVPDLQMLSFLVVAIACGWLLGRFEGRKKNSGTPFPSMDMFASEGPSETMLAILDLAKGQEAVELQLNLGAFYRRRGELDKAISIHQSLFARPDLDKATSAQVQLALASDFLNAGLFDRAERLLLELLKGHSGLKVKVLNKLVTLYEEEQDWQKILDLALDMKALKGHKSVGYACCELAEKAMKKNRWREASNLITRALKWDNKCIRALILEARMAEAEGLPQKELSSLKEALVYEPSLLNQVLPQLNSLFVSRHRPQELEKILKQLWCDAPMPVTLHSYAKHLAEHSSHDDAIAQLTLSIANVPTMAGFKLLLDELIKKNQPIPVGFLHTLKNILDQIGTGTDDYHCRQCGFDADKHYWRCPSCKQWESFTPNLAVKSKAQLKENIRINYAK